MASAIVVGIGIIIVLVGILIFEPDPVLFGFIVIIIGIAISYFSTGIKEHKILETNTYENIVFDKVVRIEYDVLKNGTKINEKIFTE